MITIENLNKAYALIINRAISFSNFEWYFFYNYFFNKKSQKFIIIIFFILINKEKIK